jgi:hypothetical protein
MISVTNAPPTISLTEPLAGASFLLPTSILIAATAADADGSIVKVEFFANDQKLGEDSSSPYSLLWTNATAGAYTLTVKATDTFGLRSTSSVPITVARSRYIAYVVPVGTIGAEPATVCVGMDFDVRTQIVVTALGVFDSGGDGINGGATLTAQLYTRSGNSGSVLATVTFTGADPGTLVGGSRMKALITPLSLNSGSYTIAYYGTSAANPIGNVGAPQPKVWSTDSGGGLIAFVGSSRSGANTPGTFPSVTFGGPADSFAAGTFEFLRRPAFPTILAGPTSIATRPGSNVTFSVAAVGNTPLSYRWRFNGVPLDGRINASLMLTNVQAPAAGGYSVVVSNALGVVTSSVATLTILFPPAITQQPRSLITLEGQNAVFTIAASGTPPIGFRWRRNNLTFTNGLIASTPTNSTLTVTNLSPTDSGIFFNVAVTNLAGQAPLSSNAFLTVLADFDRDGMADAWEATHGFNTNSVDDALDDADQDSMNNRDEYIAGTDPLDPSSYLKFERLTVSPGGAALEFLAVSNRTYSVLYQNRLSEGNWVKLVDLPERSTNRTEIVIDAVAPGRGRYYRLVTPALR